MQDLISLQALLYIRHTSNWTIGQRFKVVTHYSTYNNATGEGNIQPTIYYDIVKNAYEQLYGQPSERVIPTASRLTAP
jgi:hypothetical protein